MTNAAASNRPEPTPIPNPGRTLTVWEDGVQLDFTFADCMKYHGPVSPAASRMPSPPSAGPYRSWRPGAPAAVSSGARSGYAPPSAAPAPGMPSNS